MFVLKQSKSDAVYKDQFKPYFSWHFILTRIYLYALGTSTHCSGDLQRYSLLLTQHMQSTCLKNKIE